MYYWEMSINCKVSSLNDISKIHAAVVKLLRDEGARDVSIGKSTYYEGEKASEAETNGK